ncbi:MAG: MmgE/PrpD family protein [Dehalococcoidia bacterium]
MDVAFKLAENIINTKYDELPLQAIDITKKDILDIIGTIIAGSTAQGVEEIGSLIKEWGGKEESTVIAFDCKVPSPNAAFVNAIMGHALDYDDGHDSAILHAATTVVPASFAIAERSGNVNGKEFITAVALGVDMLCRMGLATGITLKESGWVYTSIYGYFGATASAGRLLGLNKEEMINAFGIAYSQTAGNYQAIADAVLTKRMQPGFAAKAGVLSALLAKRGITGAQNSIEGQFGLYNVFLRGIYNAHALTEELGKSFEIANIGFKPYPSCGYTHAPIYATLSLVNENDIVPDDIEEINISIGENAAELCTPLERKRQPGSIPDAQFSIPYTVATAVAKRKVEISDFTLESIKDPVVLEIAQKIMPRITPELTSRGVEPAIVEIKTKDGNRYTRREDYRKGSPQNPMTTEDIINKFRDCAKYGKKRIPEQNIEKVIELVNNLEEVDNIGEIIRLIS